MTEFDKLIVEYIKIRHDKHHAIMDQNYGSAANYRDKERHVCRKIFHILNKTEMCASDNNYNWGEYDRCVYKYFLDNYKIDLTSPYRNEDIITLIRNTKLNDLGI